MPVRVEIPAANEHPGPLFGVVAERLNRARHEPALHVTELLTSAISHLPTRFLASTMRSQAGTVDFVATSLPGIRGLRRIGGAVIEKSFPFGPRMGSLLNITGYGVDDRLDVGYRARSVRDRRARPADRVHDRGVPKFRRAWLVTSMATMDRVHPAG